MRKHFAPRTALSPRRHELSTPPHRKLTLHGAAQLAGAMLGERADWIVDYQRRPAEFTADRIVQAVFLDDVWSLDFRCHETWQLHEQRDGDRGVQVVTIGAGTPPGEGPPEGGGNTVVRVFDRDRAASVHIDGNAVSTIGDVDLAPLDLYSFTQYFKANAMTDIDALRGLVAQLVAELDAHYDTSPLWPEIANKPAHGDDPAERTFGDGTRSITIRVDRHKRTTASVLGLLWGQHVHVEMSGYLWVRLPDADIDRVLARLDAVAGLR